MLNGTTLKEIALDQLNASHGAWVAKTLEIVRRMTNGREFTTDDVWALVPPPPEPRAMGAVMIAARRARLVETTGHYRVSRRAVCHGRPIPVWRRI